MSELVLTERDSVAVVTLNRPDALNALSDALMAELVETLQELDRDEDARCIVLAGNDKAFAAGADIAELARSSAIDLYYQRRIERWDPQRATDASRGAEIGTPPAPTPDTRGEPVP